MNKEIKQYYDAYINKDIFASYNEKNYTIAINKAFNDLLKKYNNDIPDGILFYVKQRKHK